MAFPKIHLMESPAGATIPMARLSAFGDSICLRDPRARGPKPSLIRIGSGETSALAGPAMSTRTFAALEVQGPFTVLQRFAITPAEGKAFVETSRDANPIHTADSVVSGAMTAARLLLLPEVLVPSLAVKSIRLKFRAFSRYDRPTVNRYSFRPDGKGGFAVDLAVIQQGLTVADGTLRAAMAPVDAPHAPLKRQADAGEALDLMRTWLWSLRMQPELAFEALGYGYPRAFLAALPSGEMVRQAAEEGLAGLLNVLDLEFPEAVVPTLSREAPPTVEVEPTRPRNSFRRVLAKVGSGMVTHVRGYATVLLSMFAGDSKSPSVLKSSIA